MAHADLEGAALLGFRCMGLAEHAVGGGKAHTGGECELGEFTPRDPAFHSLAQCGVKFGLDVVHLVLSLSERHAPSRIVFDKKF